MTTELQTRTLILRRPTETDGEAYVDFWRSDRSRFMGGPADLREGWRAFYTEIGHWELRGYGMFTVVNKESGAPLGMCGPWNPHTWPEPEIGCVVYDHAEGRGIAFEAVLAARDYVFGGLGWTTAVSYIHPGNARAIRLAEKLDARIDMNASGIDPSDLVYRHPGPEEF